MTAERITLKGGPADGQQMFHDGGDYVEIAEKPRFTLSLNYKRKANMLPIRKHQYRRDPENRDMFHHLKGDVVL